MQPIEFNHITKEYRLGASASLRSTMSQFAKRLTRRSPDEIKTFKALDDVSFQVDKGEVLGIIGHNGAGKSTSLKLLSRVTSPTLGKIYTQGRVAALIELGAGFHPDLSGRENIYLNGSILGLKRKEIDEQFSNMVEFAGLEQFIDTPVKRYSSGMYVRLAFAVAAHVRADILLVDEVLSVGDAAYQQKCIQKMSELRDSGATIVFVSHQMWSIESFCSRVIMLKHGKIEAEGKVDRIVEMYRRQQREDLLAQRQKDTAISDAELGRLPGQTAEDTRVQIELLGMDHQPKTDVAIDEKFILRGNYFAPVKIDNPVFVLRLYRSDGLLCYESTRNDHADLGRDFSIQGQGGFEVAVGPLPLVTDRYSVEVHIVDGNAPIIYGISPREYFEVNDQPFGTNHGIFSAPADWSDR